VMGITFSMLKTALLLSVVLMFFNYLNERKEIVPKARMEESLLWNPLAGLVPFVMPVVKESEFYRGIEKNFESGTDR